MAMFAESAVRALHFQTAKSASTKFGLVIVAQPQGNDATAIAAVDETGVLARWSVMSAVTPEEKTHFLSECRHDLDVVRTTSGEVGVQIPRLKSAAPSGFYPPVLKRLGTEGCVVLELRINPEGAVETLKWSANILPMAASVAAVTGFLSSVFESPGKGAITIHTVAGFDLK